MIQNQLQPTPGTGNNSGPMLKRALNSFLGDTDLTGALARVLALASRKGRVSYAEVVDVAGDKAEEVLLLGNQWRLLVPMRTGRTASWEDRLLVAEAGELYEMANIVRRLVESACQSGLWQAGVALTELFREMGDPDWQAIPTLVERLRAASENHRITAFQIKQICAELGLGSRVDALVVELKGSGVMSPKLRSPAEVYRAGGPIFELNPSLSVQMQRK